MLRYVLICLSCKSTKPADQMFDKQHCSELCKINREASPEFIRNMPRKVILKKKKAPFVKTFLFNCRHCGVAVCDVSDDKKPRRTIAAHRRFLCRRRCPPPDIRKTIPVRVSNSKTKKDRSEKKTDTIFIPFYERREWRELRYRAIKINGRKCQACFATDKRIHVDHIKPRSKFPELELTLSNLQILCEDCNIGKSNTDETDWRPVTLSLAPLKICV